MIIGGFMKKPTKPRLNADKFYQMRQDGYTNKQIAQRYNVSVSGVRGGVSEYRKWRKWVQRDNQEPELNAIETKLPKFKQAIKPVVIRRLTYNDNNADGFWSRYKALKKSKRWVKIFFPFDKHIPFHDPDAVALDAEIIKSIGADIIIHGSDIFDFPTISRHEPDYELQQSPSFDDCYERIQSAYKEDTDRLIEAGNYPLMPFIFGNHDLRFNEMALSGRTPKTLLRLFTDLIKHEGRVHYLGNTQELLLDSLFIRHDGGAGQNVAKSMTTKDHTVHHVAGHTHRPDGYTHKAIRFTSHAMVVGCRCDLVPHYETNRGKYTSNWTQSLGMAILDTDTDAVQFTNFMYYRDETHIYAIDGTTRYSVPLSFTGVI